MSEIYHSLTSQDSELEIWMINMRKQTKMSKYLFCFESVFSKLEVTMRELRLSNKWNLHDNSFPLSMLSSLVKDLALGF